MTRILFTALILFFGAHLRAQGLSKDDVQSIKEFVKYIKDDLRTQVASEGHFPMRRQYPIPYVRDSADFINRFSEIFDKELIQKIIKSKIPEDWSQVGWRGIMLGNGVLWLEDGGGLKAVNYQSIFEKELRVSLIEKDRATLHPSMRDYLEPTCIVETDTYRIRVDKNKDETYRYSSWKKKSATGSLPELQISNGNVTFDGSGGNHRYIFAKGEFRYEIEVLLIGSDEDPPARLIVYKSDKEILNQSGSIKGD